MKVIPNKRIESDIHMVLSLKDNGVAIAWDSLEIMQVCMYSTAQKAFAGQCSHSVDPQDNHLLKVLYPANEQMYTGEHRVVVRVKLHGNENTYDALAFALVPYTGSEGSVTLEDVNIGINVEDVDTTIMKEILTACQAATDAALNTNKQLNANETTRQEQEAARGTAEKLREEAEASRTNAESNRVFAEDTRTKNEKARSNSELERGKFEIQRKEAEKTRQDNESNRTTNESRRKTTESDRVLAENARVKNENSRTSAENARVEAENARVVEEKNRTDNETTRTNAERLRESAETNRVSAENARVEAEALRVVANQQRDKIDNRVIAQAIAQLLADVEALISQASEGGQFHADSINSELLPLVAGEQFYQSGSGAPKEAPKVPFSEYWDRSSNKFYKAKGILSDSVSDWVLIN